MNWTGSAVNSMPNRLFATIAAIVGIIFGTALLTVGGWLVYHQLNHPSTPNEQAVSSTLIIFFLNVQSCYAQNTEEPATENSFDTVQFYESESGCWRIKTYATDQDVHVWSLGNNVSDMIALARSNTEKHYGDVLTEGYIIKSATGVDGLRSELAERGLTTHLEISDSGFLFWTPAGTKYESKSAPNR